MAARRWEGDERGRGVVDAAVLASAVGDLAGVFGLVGEIAEGATAMRQRRHPPSDDVDDPGAEELRFELLTGMLAGTTPFTPHRHTLLLRVVAP